MTPKNLAKAQGARNVEELRSRYLAEIFDGEEDALKSLESASNGFEHGYMATGDVRGLMEPVLERSLACVRSALIRASGVDEGIIERLLSEDYQEPRPLVRPLNIVEGELARTDPTIPVKENVPWGLIDLNWKGGEPIATQKHGDVQYTFNWEIEVLKLPENTSLTTARHGLRAAYIKPWVEEDDQASEGSASD